MPRSSLATLLDRRTGDTLKRSPVAKPIILQGVDGMTVSPILTEHHLNSLERRVKGWQYPQLTHDESAEIIIQLVGTIRRQQSEINTLLTELTDMRNPK